MQKRPRRTPDVVRPSNDFLEALRLHALGYFGVSNKYLKIARERRPPYKNTLTVEPGVYRELRRLTRDALMKGARNT